MGDLVNLRRFRKTRARDSARAEADVRAARHGETKAARAARAAEAGRLARALDGAVRESAGAAGPPAGDADPALARPPAGREPARGLIPRLGRA